MLVDTFFFGVSRCQVVNESLQVVGKLKIKMGSRSGSNFLTKLLAYNRHQPVTNK